MASAQKMVDPLLEQLFIQDLDKSGVYNFLQTRDPFVDMIKQRIVGGLEFRTAFSVGDGAIFSSSSTKAEENLKNVPHIGNMIYTAKKYKTAFGLSTAQVDACRKDQTMFDSIAAVALYKKLSAMRRFQSAMMWGYGQGDVGKTTADVADGQTVIPVTKDVYSKVSLKSEIVIAPTATAVPDLSGAIQDDKYTIVGSTPNTITVSPALTKAVPKGAWIGVSGGSNAAGDNLFPLGVPATIPIVGDRTGPEWEAYIQKPFHSLNRSVSEMCYGGFVDGTNMTFIEAMLNAIAQAENNNAKAGDYFIGLNTFDYIDHSVSGVDKAVTAILAQGGVPQLPNSVNLDKAEIGGKDSPLTSIFRRFPGIPRGYAWLITPRDWENLVYIASARWNDVDTSFDLIPQAELGTSFNLLLEDSISSSPTKVSDGFGGDDQGVAYELRAYSELRCLFPGRQVAIKLPEIA